MPEEEYDVVVVGTGAAGMVAALAAQRSGLRTVVVEKSARFGGSTARSDGAVWIPNNEVLRAAGVTDTAEAARTYLHGIVSDDVPAERIDAYLEHGPAALSFLLAHSPLRMRWVPDASDCFPDAPGGRAGGRAIEPAPFDLNRLGPQRERLEPETRGTPLNVAVTRADSRWTSLIVRTPRGLARALRIGLRRIIATITRRELAVGGQALTAALRVGLVDAGVPVLLNTPLTELVVRNGAVRGVVVGDGRVILAKHGVVLACGGFERNAEMREQYQRPPVGTEWTVGASANTGDGIRAGKRVGGVLELMGDAWWEPAIPLGGGPRFCATERALPGAIMVNDRGRRFLNEALPGVEAVHRMYGDGAGPGENIPCWLITDQRHRNRYAFAGVPPRRPLPQLWSEAGVVVQAPTIESLAEKIGVDPAALRRTVDRFNGFAREGRDADFGRGESAYDRCYGDPAVKPNPCLAPLDRGPFYAAVVVPGDTGTKGGLRTNARARVLRADGSAVDGLYAVGNVSGSVMGHTCAGPGATIGPALTFGYVAALHIAERAAARERSVPDAH